MKCDKCGKEFEAGNRPDGIPNGIGFVMKDGTSVTLCADCVIREGAATAETEGMYNDEH